MPQLIDISVTLQPGIPVWPTNSPLTVIQELSMKTGGIANVTSFATNSHTGTHIDAPLHFVDDAKTVETIPLDKLIGSCHVAHLPGKARITADDLEKCGLPTGLKKLLLKTDNSFLWDNPVHKFKEDFCAITADASQWIVDRGIHLIGIDYLSIQLFHDPADTHVILLSNEVVILEGLDLRQVEPGQYRLICLPLKFKGVEGALARAVLERE